MFSLSSLSRTLCSVSPLLRLGQLNSQPTPTTLGPLSIFSRARSQLAPRQVKHIKRHKGRVPIPIGGSTKGTTLAYGDYGIRIKSNGHRFTAKQLSTAEEVIKRKARAFKGLRVYLRVFPDIPVCIKGNETRMGKGKGTFEYWATRVPTGRVIFEIGGVPIREELARDMLRQAAAKLPTKMEFITRSTPPRLGSLVLHPSKPDVESPPLATAECPALLETTA
ncbi:hypothetical protein M378DRAFT_199826 [Amanita muscaria Koide BX008]|uniref:Uncharacterized protein n=1 Tax=Amanita muscaria (strain Koide BX008) TaxID=946122 RepID=A0A0C2WU74_AMAMK|nr:hypothetical protein M378DRAFT_199826 [Amanita muscaria Koide BX008]